MAEIARMVVVLSLICGLSGFTLAFLRSATARQIEIQVLTYVQKPAIERVFGETENDPLTDRKSFTLPDGKSVTVFPAIRGGRLYGVAIEEFAMGYADDVGVIVGIDTQSSRLIGIGVTTMRETPGLGTLIAEPKFSGQFRGASPDVELRARGGTIDAVAGATVSSVAAVESVRKAVAAYEQLKDEIASAWQ